MDAESGRRHVSVDIQVGRSCILAIAGQRHMVAVTSVVEDVIQTSYPGMAEFAEGCAAVLEFLMPGGTTWYATEISNPPWPQYGCVTLLRPVLGKRNVYRSAVRVPTDLTVQIRAKAHARSYDAELRDLSMGGELVETCAPLEVGSDAETTISLPGEPLYTIPSRVVYKTSVAEFPFKAEQLCGLRFTSLSEDAASSIRRYTASKVRTMNQMAAPEMTAPAHPA